MHVAAPNPIVAERPMYFNFRGWSGGDDVVGAKSLGKIFYFAEGYVGDNFAEFLTLANPGLAPADVKVEYFSTSGPLPAFVHPVAARSRLTIQVSSDVGVAGPVSIKVTSDQPIVAERPMYFDFNGLTGGHVVIGARDGARSVNLAEGHVNSAFFEYLTMLNPGVHDTLATVTFYPSAGGAATTVRLAVPAGTRQTLSVNAVLPSGTSHSTNVAADQPLIVERPMYFDYLGRTGGHDALAAADDQMSTSALFAEGYTGGGFNEYLTVLNRSNQAAAGIVTYYFTDGHTVSVPHDFAASSRTTIHVGDPGEAGLGESVSVAISVTNGVAILVERPIYFSF